MYLDQLKKLAEPLGVPILTGQTPQQKRDEVFAEFREGRLRVLVVSKIANFAVDLPDASVAIQISAPSVRARKKRNGWAGFCARRKAPIKLTFTPL